MPQPTVNINVNALNFQYAGLRATDGRVDRFDGFLANQGPLIRNNVLDRNEINGMVVRGGTLTTESVWDDTDMVHVLLDGVYVPNIHTFGGLRLKSSQTESLVIKLDGDSAGFSRPVGHRHSGPHRRQHASAGSAGTSCGSDLVIR